MRTHIKEEKSASGQTVYRKSQRNFEGEEIHTYVVAIKGKRYTDEYNRTYYLLYDTNLKVISPVFKYINYHLENQSINTKEMALVALKQLYAYCELFDLVLENISSIQVQSLLNFLYGINSKGEFNLQLSTKRSPETVNNYITTYRSYFEFLDVKENAFNSKTIGRYSKASVAKGLLGHLHKNDTSRYKITQKISSRKKVPKYIGIDEYKKIIECVRERFTLREEIIIRLMFETGLRIGEVLGLTLEDVRTTAEEMESLDIEDVGKISIVNRVSDKSYQMAKNRFIPKDKSSYELSVYQEENMQYVYPKIMIIVLLDKYIEEVHGNLSDTTRLNYLAAIADKVDEKSFKEENYYIFLNKNGKPLSKSGWNKILRDIFNIVGLDIDNDRRRNNLSHRFRHGYAMYLVQHRNYTPLQLKDALRHRSMSTVMTYYNPTEEDIYEINKEAADTLYKIYPNLLEEN